MSKRKSDDELIDFLSPVSEMWKSNSSKSLNHAIEEWQHLLTSDEKSQPLQPIKRKTLWTLFNLLISNPINSILIWMQYRIEKNNVFEARTLKRLKKLNLIQINEKGIFTLLPAPIPPATGQSLIYILFVFSGIWIGWIIFGDSVGLKMVCNSFAVGMLVGTLVSIILDLSYSQKEIYEKLRKLDINLNNPIS